MKKWTEQTARKMIERNGGKIRENSITIPRCGIKVLGAIDYLVNHRRYFWSATDRRK